MNGVDKYKVRSMGNQLTFDKTTEKNPDEKMKTAARGLAGLWKNHNNELSVEETIRDLRKGRLLGSDHYSC